MGGFAIRVFPCASVDLPFLRNDRPLREQPALPFRGFSCLSWFESYPAGAAAFEPSSRRRCTMSAER